ncbi:MAG TPA: LuxR C-terminal-related transcriptional regulator, partial [Ktedonobacterales bacterium]|nr:LuxR C-terminal-related transcriptional regulator [Ktedonobacterales bacterium]
LLGEALALAEPEECIRTFIDEGPPMARMLAAAAAQGMMPTYVGKLLAIFAAEKAQRQREATADLPSTQPLIEPLSQREREILQLIAQGLSNAEIGERLFLALDTVKGLNRKIFGKLQVQRRTEAVALARELGLVKALLETGKVVPVVDGRYALSETAATMRHVEGTSKARS